MRILAGLVASAAVMMAAGPSLGATWACGAKAGFNAGMVDVYLKVGDKGGSAHDATVNYTPAPPDTRLSMMIEYPAQSASDGQYAPRAAYAVADTSQHAGEDITLTVGGDSFRESLSANVPELTGSRFHVFVSFPVTPELRAALAKGGPGKLQVTDREGRIEQTQELTFATPGAIRSVSAQAYKAASGYAANPGQSEFCSKLNGF